MFNLFIYLGLYLLGGFAAFWLTRALPQLFGEIHELFLPGKPDAILFFVGAFLFWPIILIIGLILQRFALDRPNETELESNHQSKLIGAIGKCITPLRPFGKTKIDGQTFEARTNGTYLDAGARVIIVSTEHGRVLVEPFDDPRND